MKFLWRLFPAIWANFFALAIALWVGSLLIFSVGGDPYGVARLLLHGTWQSGYGLGQVLFKTTPLIFTGLAVAISLRAGLFNIGAEGQLTVGALCTAWVGNLLPVGTSGLIAIPLCLLAGFFGGAITGAIPGVLKAWRGSHEVINTIMLNFVVRASMVGIGAHLFVRESVHTPPIILAARLERLSRYLPAFHGSAVNSALLIAVGTCIVAYWLFARTPFGFRLRVVGASTTAAKSAGISVGQTTILAMALSGGVAGLGGCNFVLGYKYYYEDGFTGGVGFMGIAVAVLAQSHPLWLCAAALLFGTLSQGALAINASVPKELVDVLQAVIIFSVAASTVPVRAEAQRLLARLRSRA